MKEFKHFLRGGQLLEDKMSDMKLIGAKPRHNNSIYGCSVNLPAAADYWLEGCPPSSQSGSSQNLFNLRDVSDNWMNSIGQHRTDVSHAPASHASAPGTAYARLDANLISWQSCHDSLSKLRSAVMLLCLLESSDTNVLSCHSIAL